MKTLANCNPVDFLRQTNKIRHAVSGWLNDTGVLEIRKRQPVLTGKEKPEELERKQREQAKKNINDMLDSMLENHAQKTAEVLGLMCFVDPEEVEDAKGFDFLLPAMELLSSKPVIDFLLSYLKLEQMSTGDTSRLSA